MPSESVGPVATGDITSTEYAFTPQGQQSIIDSLVGEEPTQESADFYEGHVEVSPQDAFDLQDDPESQEEADGLPQASQEDQAAYMQAQQQWNASSEEERSQLADEYLTEQYVQNYNDISPRQAVELTNAVGQAWGIEGFASHVDPQQFACWEETWGNHAEQTLQYHPNGASLIEAVAANDAQTAAQLAATMIDPTMAARALAHLGSIVGEDLGGYNPTEAAARLLINFIGLKGWAQPQPQHDSPFQSNGDLFDSEAMDLIARQGLL